MIQTLFGTPPPQPGLLDRFKKAVSKTRDNLREQIDEIIQGEKEIDAATLDDLEMILIGADIGVHTTDEIIEHVRAKMKRNELTDGNALKRELALRLMEIVKIGDGKDRQPVSGPRVSLIVGVNGTGKTTTIGKLANRYRNDGKKVLLCAADTFRAAAAEQLEIWGQRTGCDVIRQKAGSDPSAVLFDALQAAKARGVDEVIVDTAGRLHTKSNLMAELEKMKRTAGRILPGSPHEVLLVLDAVTGQNGLEQARQFTTTAGVTGLVLTKLDGTAKGGIVVAIARELELPIRFVGIGEQADDLVPFDADSFVRSLFEG
jgi:fused signal recognition particle receptor